MHTYIHTYSLGMALKTPRPGQAVITTYNHTHTYTHPHIHTYTPALHKYTSIRTKIRSASLLLVGGALPAVECFRGAPPPRVAPCGPRVSFDPHEQNHIHQIHTYVRHIFINMDSLLSVGPQGCVNRVRQQGASTGCVNRVRQQGESTGCVNRILLMPGVASTGVS